MDPTEQYADLVSNCTCDECVQMCETRPCWGTPGEIAEIIRAGHGNKLMLDYWVGTYDHIAEEYEPDTQILCPAIEMFERKHAPFMPLGRCTFLDAHSKCVIYDIRPLEAKIAYHGQQNLESLHGEIAQTWNTPAGKVLVAKWLEGDANV